MKVTVTKNLNVRVGAPSVNAPCYNYLAPGSVIEVEDVIVEGDTYDENNKWYRGLDGSYYWSGGVAETQEGLLLPVTTHTNVKANYNNLLNLSPEIKATKGKGITICVIDTGCIMHQAFVGKQVTFHNVVDGIQNDFGDGSSKGHGTFVSALISTNESTSNEIIGVAPASNLNVIRATKGNGFSLNNVSHALDWLLEQEKMPDILNLSFDLSFDAAIKTKLEMISSKGTLIVAAGQNDINLYNDDAIFFPASEESIIAVGALNANIPGAKLSKRIKYVLPNLSYRSASNIDPNYYTEMNGSSFASAMISGSLALVKSYYGLTDKVQILQKLDEQLDSISSFDNKSLRIYKNEN